jgi:hypothetical protein
MVSTKNWISLVVAVVALMALPMAARSALVGSVSTSDGSVIGGGDWTTDVTLGWEISDAPGDNYLYSYTFQAPDPGLSHFILQTSDNFTVNNVLEISNEYALNTFTSGDGNSNPGLEGDLYGIKFEGFEEGSPWTFTLLSDKAPMEGDFYAKGGDDSFAYNSGFGEGEGGTGAKILVPDTLTQRVPEAGAMLLFGSGLLGLVGYRRARRMQ